MKIKVTELRRIIQQESLRAKKRNLHEADTIEEQNSEMAIDIADSISELIDRNGQDIAWGIVENTDTSNALIPARYEDIEPMADEIARQVCHSLEDDVANLAMHILEELMDSDAEEPEEDV